MRKFSKILCEDVKLMYGNVPKIRVDTYNNTDVIQEKPKGLDLTTGAVVGYLMVKFYINHKP